VVAVLEGVDIPIKFIVPKAAARLGVCVVRVRVTRVVLNLAIDFGGVQRRSPPQRSGFLTRARELDQQLRALIGALGDALVGLRLVLVPAVALGAAGERAVPAAVLLVHLLVELVTHQRDSAREVCHASAAPVLDRRVAGHGGARGDAGGAVVAEEAGERRQKRRVGRQGR
jgi:hypothetical protein